MGFVTVKSLKGKGNRESLIEVLEKHTNTRLDTFPHWLFNSNNYKLQYCSTSSICQVLFQDIFRLNNSDLSHVTSVGEVVIARAHVTVLPRLLDAETRRIAGGWSIVQLILQVATSVAPFIEMKVQLLSIELINMVNHFKR